MKLCPQIILSLIAVFFFSAGMAVAQVGVDGNLAYSFSELQLDKPAVNQNERFVIRNRMDSGAMWTVSADALLLYRSGGQSFPLLLPVVEGEMEPFMSRDFEFQMGVGPRVSIVGEDLLFGFGIEASYFGIDNWSASRTIASPAGGMQYMLFGEILYTLPEGIAVDYDYDSRLHNAEINIRRPIWENVSVLAGFRFMQLHERLNSTILDEEPVINFGFDVDNHLYGGQIGLNVAFINRPRFSIEGVLKAGVFGNYSDLTLLTTSGPIPGDNTTHTAFLGEVGLMGIVQVTSCLSLRGGYQAMWLDGIGIASDQFQSVDPVTLKPYMGGTLLYHGAFAGLECAF